ncbi:hypothetical protein KNE206_77000 [Kitasatospora sp. NE20-6]|uniref:hypothetical protein n=1 Tax=Kitasatospora sp. NE20-6 TaxID=2859066 RepID=UPI0034DBC300
MAEDAGRRAWTRRWRAVPLRAWIWTAAWVVLTASSPWIPVLLDSVDTAGLSAWFSLFAVGGGTGWVLGVVLGRIGACTAAGAGLAASVAVLLGESAALGIAVSIANLPVLCVMIVLLAGCPLLSGAAIGASSRPWPCRLGRGPVTDAAPAGTGLGWCRPVR